MKLLRRDIDKRLEGPVILLTETVEDLWGCYNLVAEGDLVKCKSYRKVQSERAGIVKSEKKQTELTIQIEKIDFEPNDGLLFLKGQTTEENRFVSRGSYHTLNIGIGQKFTLYKAYWDSIYLKNLAESTNQDKQASIAAILMNDGMANIFLITPTLTITKQKIDQRIPKKRKYSTKHHDRELNRFYEQIIDAIIKYFDFSLLDCVILASPGFVKDNFFQYMKEHSRSDGENSAAENLDKFVIVHSNSCFKHSLNEILLDKTVQARISDTKVSVERKVLEKFTTKLRLDPNKAVYGPEHVRVAAENHSIETLLISDKMFLSSDIAERKKYIELVEDVKNKGGTVHILSSRTEPGEFLAQFTGVAGILKFSLDVDSLIM